MGEEIAGYKVVEFTLYDALPYNKKMPCGFLVQPEVWEKAGRIKKSGYRFTCVILTTGEVSLSIHNITRREDAALEIAPAGAGVKGLREAVTRLVVNF